MPIFRIQTALVAGFSLALLVQQAGCSALHYSSVVGNSADAGGQGRLIGAYSDLHPDGQPGKTANMIMAGTKIPVDISVKTSGARFEITLHAHGETFETEQYQTATDSFALEGASGDHYAPKLDLLRFPMHVGDTWNWEGTISSGGIQRKATAVVSTSSTTLYTGGAAAEAVKVDVVLGLYSEGSKTPAERKLSFEFVPGRGIVRREFGDASVREPASG